MRTFTILSYLIHGTETRCVDVDYRGATVASFTGGDAAGQALRYVSDNGGRAVVRVAD